MTINVLNDLIREKLETAGCRSGHLRAEVTGTLLLTLKGTRIKDDKPILIWETGYPLQKAVRDYMEEATPNMAILDIDIELSGNAFIYHHTSSAERNTLLLAEEQQRKEDEKQRQLNNKQQLAADTAPFGNALAEKVANALQRRSLGYAHRDYCGMGLAYKDGRYCYGELWDGMMLLPAEAFTSKDAFISWLARQSNASFSRIQEKDPWVWGNQVITRTRLEEFCHG